jgi:hypothetical protein
MGLFYLDACLLNLSGRPSSALGRAGCECHGDGIGGIVGAMFANVLTMVGTVAAVRQLAGRHP